MEALMKMLVDTSTGKFHPIMYLESPLPGGDEANKTLVRYKSKGHYTIGFSDRDEAVQSAMGNQAKLESMGYRFNHELENDMPWDGSGIPADICFAHRK